MATRPDTGVAANDSRWTPSEAAEFAARRDFRLLQLLSKDRRAFAAARRLGLHATGTRNGARGQEPSNVVSSGQPKRRSMQTQTLRDSEDATLNSAKRRSRARMQKYIERKRTEEEAASAQRQHTISALSPMDDVPDRSSLEGEVQRLQTQLTESEERVRKFRKACTHWKIQHTRLLETVQQQQPMDEGGAPTRPRSPTASVGTANGDGARTPPKKNALSLNDVVRAEKAVLEAASEALAAKGKVAGKGRGGGRG